jgi:glutamine cyclotransferase
MPVALLFQGCMNDDDLWESNGPIKPLTSGGLFVVNEGNFTYGNASLSFYDMEQGEVHQDIFYGINGLPLGDVAHSMTIRDSLGYVVINNSGRIYVINVKTFEYVGKITGLTSPRYIHFVDEKKAYVTDLYARSIAIVNPLTYEVIGSIPVSNSHSGFFQHSTEQMLQYDKYVYTNCWSFDNQILIIDSELDRVVDSIEVLKQPNSMVLDRNNSLWILSDGGFQESPYGYEAPGLMRIKADSRELEIIHRFEEGEKPSELKITGTGDTLYFINKHIFRYVIENSSEPELLVSSPHKGSVSGGYYALEVDPISSHLYVADAIDHLQRGNIYRFNSTGAPIDTFSAGISPGAFCFTPDSP